MFTLYSEAGCANGVFAYEFSWSEARHANGVFAYKFLWSLNRFYLILLFEMKKTMTKTKILSR